MYPRCWWARHCLHCLKMQIISCTPLKNASESCSFECNFVLVCVHSNVLFPSVGSKMPSTHACCFKGKQSLSRCKCRYQIWVTQVGTPKKKIKATYQDRALRLQCHVYVLTSHYLHELLPICIYFMLFTKSVSSFSCAEFRHLCLASSLTHWQVLQYCVSVLGYIFCVFALQVYKSTTEKRRWWTRSFKLLSLHQ